MLLYSLHAASVHELTITVVHMHALNKSALRLISHDSFDLHVKAIVINFISSLFLDISTHTVHSIIIVRQPVHS